MSDLSVQTSKWVLSYRIKRIRRWILSAAVWRVDSSYLAKDFAADDSKLVFTPFDFLGKNMFNRFRLARAEHVSVVSFVGAQGGFCAR